MPFWRCFSKWAAAVILALPLTLFIGGIPWTISSLFIVPYKGTASRSVEASNLRQICQATLIYAADNHDKLPEADDLVDYARLLALGGGLNDASIWVSYEVGRSLPSDFTRILVTLPDGSREVDSRFAQLPHLFTVVIAGLTAADASITPVAWTRGLDLETGRWREDSPYKGEGGHVAFLGGNVQFFGSLRNGAGGELWGVDGRRTHRILDALPKNARISSDPAPAASPPSFLERMKALWPKTPQAIRQAILLSWPLWMLALFFKFTLKLVRIWGLPIRKLRFEPNVWCLVIVPTCLLVLSVIFRL